jgi:hypothetical protein
MPFTRSGDKFLTSDTHQRFPEGITPHYRFTCIPQPVESLPGTEEDGLPSDPGWFKAAKASGPTADERGPWNMRMLYNVSLSYIHVEGLPTPSRSSDQLHMLSRPPTEAVTPSTMNHLGLVSSDF